MQKQTESGAALAVPPVRSNFAQKNAYLPRLIYGRSKGKTIILAWISFD